MTIDKYICNLLYHHNCVIIPGLGGLIGNYRSAFIITSKNSIYPPSKKIAFNARLTENDGLLVNYISQQEHISYIKSLELVSEYVEEVLAELNSGNRITIENIGLLFYDDEKSIQFHPDNQSNFLTESFGLSPVNAVQIDKEKRDAEKYVQPEYEFRSKSSTETRSYWKVAEVIPVAALILFMLIYPQKIRDINSGIASIVDIDLPQCREVDYSKSDFMAHQSAANSELNKKIKAALGDGKTKMQLITDNKRQNVAEVNPIEKNEFREAEKSTPVIHAEIIADEKSIKYFIIVGSFKIEENAKNYVETLKQKGFNASIPGRRKGLIMVSCFSSESNEQLQTELQKVQSSLESQAWIYKKD